MAKSSRLRDQLYMLQGSRCFYCDRAIAPSDRSLEHIIADSIGGFANEENAVVVCQDANHLLGDASPKRKMMMLKAGGGRIECPKLGSCAKPQGQQQAKIDHTVDPLEVKGPQKAAALKQQPHSNHQQQANGNQRNNSHQQANDTQRNESGNSRNQRSKPKKKPRPHLKSTRSVH